jgi:hypothetical protein
VDYYVKSFSSYIPKDILNLTGQIAECPKDSPKGKNRKSVKKCDFKDYPALSSRLEVIGVLYCFYLNLTAVI